MDKLTGHVYTIYKGAYYLFKVVNIGHITNNNKDIEKSKVFKEMSAYYKGFECGFKIYWE